MTLSILKPTTNTEPMPSTLMDKDARKQLGQLTLRALSGTYVLMLKTQAVHWNIAGPLFKSVHDLTEDQYDDLFAAVDGLAERIRALGLSAPMNFGQMQATSSLKSFGDEPMPAGEMIAELAEDHERLAADLTAGAKAAADMNDLATEDAFVERLRIHQKHAWMLRALLATETS